MSCNGIVFWFVLVSDCNGRSLLANVASHSKQQIQKIQPNQMSDTEEDSLSSESWPINEDWLIEVLKKHHEVRSGIKITVSFHSKL